MKKVELDVLLCRFMYDIDRNLLNDCINFSGRQNSLIFSEEEKKKQRVLEMTFSNFSCMFLNPNNGFQFEF